MASRERERSGRTGSLGNRGTGSESEQNKNSSNTIVRQPVEDSSSSHKQSASISGKIPTNQNQSKRASASSQSHPSTSGSTHVSNK